MKIYLTPFNENDKPVVQRKSKISMIDPRYPIVKFKKLSPNEISKYTKENTENVPLRMTRQNVAEISSGIADQKKKSQHSKKCGKTTRNDVETVDDKTIEFPNTTSESNQTMISKENCKRKSAAQNFTVPKKRKITNDIGLPRTQSISVDRIAIEQVHQEKKNQNSNGVISKEQFSVGDVFWGKMRGWCHWPAKIVAIDSKKIEVVWFNDYRRSKLFRTQLFNFYENSQEFTKKCTSNVGLDTAVKEALIYLGNANKISVY